MKIKIQTIVLTVILMIICGASAFANGSADNALNERKPAVVNQNLVIQISDLTGYVNFYPVVIDGLQMEIMAVRAQDGSIRTAFNACHFCYQRNDDPKVKGYFMQLAGPKLVSLCGSERLITMDKIQISAPTCHPEPLLPENRITAASTITISRDYLRRAKNIFAEMKLMNEKGSCCD